MRATRRFDPGAQRLALAINQPAQCPMNDTILSVGPFGPSQNSDVEDAQEVPPAQRPIATLCRL